MSKFSWQYRWLVLLFLVAGYFSMGHLAHVIRILIPQSRVPDAYFPVRMATREFGTGPYFRWQVLDIDGKPFTRGNQIREAIRSRGPGGRIPVTLKSPSGEIRQVDISVHNARPNSPLQIILLVAVSLFLQVFCFALAFFVAGVRPYDPLAWLLLALLLSFGETVHDYSWDWPYHAAAMIWNLGVRELWPVCMMLFGLYFPKRSNIDRKWPWLKWVLGASVLAASTSVSAINFTWSFNIEAALPFRGFFLKAVQGQSILSMAAISLFFAGLGSSTGTAKDRDSQRRLAFLWMGASVSLTPMFLLSVYALVSGRDMFIGVPGWTVITALLLLPLFPLTLAYVIVVQRAMNLKMALRLGLQYTLARGGFRILQAIVVTVIIAAIVFGIREDMKARDQLRIIALGILGVALQRRLSLRVSDWIDRKFFREAYSADRVLIELSEQARLFTETRPLLEKVTDSVARTLHVPRAAVLLRDGDNYCLAKTAGGFDPAVRCLPLRARAIEHIRNERKPALIYFDDQKSWVNAIEPEEKRRLQALDAQVLVALSGRDDLVGVMVLGPKQSEEPYSRNDLRLLQSVGAQTGLALENSELLTKLSAEAARRERLNRELEIAREVQERLFPQDYPPVPGVDYCGHCRPAMGIGGDYYDFIHLQDGRLGIAIGDVSGKGVAAALLMSNLHASVRGQALAGISCLATMMSNINVLMYEASTTNRYATFFYGEYNPNTRRLVFVNAGHNAPMLVRGGQCIRLEDGGPVVGLFKNASYQQASCDLQPGDLLLGYTDGVSEAMTSDEEEWGEECMLDAVRECLRLTARETIDFLIRAADVHTTGAPQYDDMTLSVVKIL